MTAPLVVTLVGLGLGGGFLSGLLGLGGAIFMIPLLLYVPPLLGVGLLTMKQVLLSQCGRLQESDFNSTSATSVGTASI